MNWRDLFERALLLLGTVVAEASDEKYPQSLVRAYIQRHASSIVWLAADAKVLMDAGCIAAVPLIVRGMLESGFILAAAANESGFAAEKMLAEIADLQKRTGSRLGKDTLLAEFEELERNLRGECNFTGSPRKFTVKDVADIAELDVHYEFEYFLYSQHTHATFSGLLATHNDEHLPARNLRAMAHVLIVAAGYTAALLETHTPQLNIDRAEGLIDELLILIEGERKNDGAA